MDSTKCVKWKFAHRYVLVVVFSRCFFLFRPQSCQEQKQHCRLCDSKTSITSACGPVAVPFSSSSLIKSTIVASAKKVRVRSSPSSLRVGGSEPVLFKRAAKLSKANGLSESQCPKKRHNRLCGSATKVNRTAQGESTRPLTTQSHTPSKYRGRATVRDCLSPPSKTCCVWQTEEGRTPLRSNLELNSNNLSGGSETPLFRPCSP